MKIILTEEQYKYILVENTLKDTLKELKISSGVLFTFGTGIGAFIGPVERLLSGSGFSMNQKDIILLIITSFALLITSPGLFPFCNTILLIGILFKKLTSLLYLAHTIK